MKKIFTTLVAVLAIFQISYAQWNTGTAGKITTLDNVGIGTTIPGALLNVHGGNVLVTSPYPGTVNNPQTTSVLMETINSGGFRVAQTGMAAVFSRLATSADYASNLVFYNTADNTQTERMRINHIGYVGIGTNSPGVNLDVSGTADVYGRIQSTSGDNNATGLIIKGGGTNANWLVGTNTSSTSGNADDLFFYKASGTVGPKMIIQDNGNIGIGTRTPDAKLTVNGTIHSTDVIVDNGIMPDYVFEPNYKLLSLKQVKAYIDKNHHLPEVPSAQEVAKAGLKLVEMNNALLKKVEELTLYLIEKDKQLEDQQALLKKFETRLTNLESPNKK